MRIYLDNNATTQADAHVVDAIANYLKHYVGNPSSSHADGRAASQTLHEARHTIASYLGVKPQEIIFTSGGTEGVNMLLRGAFLPNCQGHLITSNVEHASMYETAKLLETWGTEVTYLPAGPLGAVSADAVQQALRPHTKLIALIGVNNETGVKTNIETIAALAQEAGVPFFVDAVAWLGKGKIPIPEGVTAICFSGHKVHAPKGIGFIYLRNKTKLTPLMTGGGQEYLRRAGTENMSGIVGMAEAIRQIEHAGEAAVVRMRMLRDRLEQGLSEQVPDLIINGAGPRIENLSNIAFPGISGEELLMRLDMKGISASHGSACLSGGLEPSRILLSMGLSPALARSSLRFSLSRFTTEQEIEKTIIETTEIVKNLRKRDGHI